MLRADVSFPWSQLCTINLSHLLSTHAHTTRVRNGFDCPMGAAASLPMQFDEASLREVLPGLSDVDASEATAAGPVSCENVFLALGTMPPAAIQPALDASVVDVVEAT